MKKFIILLVGCLFLVGCEGQMQNTESSLDSILSKGNYIIVDVRTKEEYESGHIRGAINIPYDEIDEETTLDYDKTILVYCKSGARSQVAWDTLNKLGYTTYDLGAFSEIDLPKE